MALNVDEIRRELKESRKGKTLAQARAHQDRIKFHSDTHIAPIYSQPLSDFLSVVKTILPEDKFNTFKTLMRYPLATNEIVATIFDKLSKVFEGQNPSATYSFTSAELADDWEQYRSIALNEPAIWKTTGWDFFKSEINSVLIVDLPVQQVSDRPEPYFYFLRIENVLAFSASPTSGLMDWIIFKSGEDLITVIDDETYRVFTYKNALVSDSPLIENPHGLGYCPAKFFCETPLNLSEPDVKKSPISDVLERLDWFLFYHTSKKHLDLYGSYPIYSGYAQECDFHNDATGEHCDGGFLKDKSGQPLYDASGLLRKCPRCGSKKITGPCSFVEVPIPDADQPDLRNPITITTVDSQSLNYNVEETKRLKEDIINASVGVDSTVITSQAVNEKQVSATYESKTTILDRLKLTFENARKFVDDTICKLRYGSEYKGLSISLGTSFYILSPMDMRNNYVAAKNSGASESELDSMRTRIIEAEYRNDPVQLRRMLMLNYLEPLRNMSTKEAMDAFDRGVIGKEKLAIKLNFPEYVSRFENENGNITEFGSAIQFRERIRKINEVFASYAKDDVSSIPTTQEVKTVGFTQ